MGNAIQSADGLDAIRADAATARDEDYSDKHEPALADECGNDSKDILTRPEYCYDDDAERDVQFQ